MFVFAQSNFLCGIWKFVKVEMTDYVVESVDELVMERRYVREDENNSFTLSRKLFSRI